MKFSYTVGTVSWYKPLESNVKMLIVFAAAAAAKSLQSCPTPSDPMDCSPPGSSVHGIFQARVVEWGAIAFYKALSKSCQINYLTLSDAPLPLSPKLCARTSLISTCLFSLRFKDSQCIC